MFSLQTSVLLASFFVCVTFGNDCGYPEAAVWKNWFENLDPSDTRVVYPTSDAEVISVLSTALSNGCVVRPAGTGHSGDGIVTQKLEEDVLVLSLADYVAPDEWNLVLDETKPSIKISAGATWLDLIAHIRPQGYLLKQQTAGFSFQIGGVIMNPSVHGSARGQGRVHANVLSLRVLTYNGTDAIITNITDENELFKWRGSMGLLGLVLCAEIAIKQDEGLFMGTFTNFMTNWNQENVESFLDYLITLDSSLTLYNPYTDKFTTLYTISDYYNNTHNSSFDAAATSLIYDALLAENEDLAKTGSFIEESVDLLTSFVSSIGSFPVSQLIARTTTALIEQLNADSFESNFAQQRDLFTFDFFPAYQGIASFVPWERRFEALDQVRTLLQSYISNQDSQWYPDGPALFRIIDIDEDISLWDSTPSGRYISLDVTTVKDFFGEDAYNEVLMSVEQIWISLNGRPHHGKEWGYGYVSDADDSLQLPVPFPWIDADLIEFYTHDRSEEIVDAMEEYDPHGVFRAGGSLRTLGSAYEAGIMQNYEPRSLVGQSCRGHGNAECISQCCCDNLLQCAHDEMYNICLVFGVIESGELCDVDCECVSGECKVRFFQHGDFRKRCSY